MLWRRQATPWCCSAPWRSPQCLFLSPRTWSRNSSTAISAALVQTTVRTSLPLHSLIFAVHDPLIHSLISPMINIIFVIESLLLYRYLALTSISSPLAVAEHHQTARSPSLSLFMWLISSLSWSSLIVVPWGRAHDHLHRWDAVMPLLLHICSSPASVSDRRCHCWLHPCYHESPVWAIDISSILHVDPYCKSRTLVYIC